MPVHYFEPIRLYDDCDPELDVLAPKTLRAQWRHRGFGPDYVKMGRRVKYSGQALNDWIAVNTVKTGAA